MKTRVTPGSVLLAALLLAQTAATGASTPRPGIDWPQFRGIRAGGIDERHPAPVTWDVGRKQAVRWKTPIPGLGHSSPVVWGDAVFVATSISGQKDAGIKVGYYGDIDPVKDDTPHEWRVYALDKKTGAVRWQKTVLTSVPKIKRRMSRRTRIPRSPPTASELSRSLDPRAFMRST